MKKEEAGYLFLRISMGLMIALHGVMKMVGGMEFMAKLGSLPPFIPDWPAIHPWLGILATAVEFFGGLMIMAGWGTRYAGIAIAVILMAGFTYHIGGISDFSSLMRNTWPLEIMFVFLAVSIIGPGKYRLAGLKKKTSKTD